MTRSHDQGLFEVARRLCAELDHDVDAIKRGLSERGADGQAIRRIMHQMRAEGRIVRAPMELSENQRYIRDAKAGMMHLVDLKRAGHSSRFTELRITSESTVGPASLRARRLRVEGSGCGSAAAACAEMAF